MRSARLRGVNLRATTFVINMDRDDARLTHMDDELGSGSYTRWQAVRLRHAGFAAYKRFLHPDIFKHPHPIYTLGNMGCALSHFSLMEKLGLVSDAEFVVVFEDDVTLVQPLARIHAFVRTLPPDWDMVNLAAHYPGEAKPRLERVQQRGGIFWRTLRSTAGAFAMAYKVASLRKLVALVPTVFGKSGQDPNTDSVLSALAPHVKYYVVDKGRLVDHAYMFDSSRASMT
eukprot:g4282.t1